MQRGIAANTISKGRKPGTLSLHFRSLMSPSAGSMRRILAQKESLRRNFFPHELRLAVRENERIDNR
jgi:hypothetical protein